MTLLTRPAAIAASLLAGIAFAPATQAAPKTADAAPVARQILANHVPTTYARFHGGHFGGHHFGGFRGGHFGGFHGRRFGYGGFHRGFYGRRYFGRRFYRGYGYGYPYYGYGFGYPYYGYGYGPGLGVATGVILGGALAAAASQPAYGGPGYRNHTAYCLSRFKSYDPRSGTYLGYDGHRHPC